MPPRKKCKAYGATLKPEVNYRMVSVAYPFIVPIYRHVCSAHNCNNFERTIHDQTYIQVLKQTMSKYRSKFYGSKEISWNL